MPVTSEAKAALRAQEAAETAPEAPEPGRDDAAGGGRPAVPATEDAVAGPRGDDAAADDTAGEPTADARKSRGWRRRDRDEEDEKPPRRSWSGPRRGVLVGLTVLWVLLLGAAAFLWFRPPVRSSVTTADYVQALEAARSEVVDLTSFDYVTLDADIARIKRVSTGDLQKESVAQLDKQRQQLTQSQAVVNTQVIGAGVTKADADSASVLLVIQSTQKSSASPQAQVVRYRIEAQLKKIGGKWLLSGISGR